ncbi:phosphopentomutase-like [Tubulanus polymorphus]|uniref:phosphopentomutase-like n=1 Tax=Tubulanus polymorphus TaxID=672921 RepID=UPI003DA30950
MEFDTGNVILDSKLKEWILWDKSEKSLSEIQQLLEGKEYEELEKRLCKRMEFGTAGLRARMGAGYSMMNDLTIVQTGQGLASYCEKVFPDIHQKGIIIGYDARYNSSKFAWLTASIFLQKKIPVYLFSSITPTPFVPYGVLHYGCKAGIMVTASHNPKEDNGYKVYWDNGSQIIPPHDSGISAEILANLEPLESSWDTSIVEKSQLCKDPYTTIKINYFTDVTKLCHHKGLNGMTKVKFTYTAMHGVGWHFCEDSFKAFGLPPFIPVTEQVEPDPEFPTVPFPNPEEGKSALNLSISTADKHGSTVILANDPDADRLAVAEKQPDGSWKVFTGNEIGALLGWWMFRCFKEINPGSFGPDVYMLSSTVSSAILKSIASKEGFSFEDTLTGFKWMGNRADELIKDGKTVLFAFEEAIGFMCGTNVLDKDGVSACAVMAEMATWLEDNGLTLTQKLNEIYTTYGHHKSNNSYFICHHKPTIDSLFSRLRNFSGENTYPTHMGKYAIKSIRDLTTGFDNNFSDNRARLPVSKSSHMITFQFENGCVLTLRTSGTEPKIKFYTEFCADPSKNLNPDDVVQELELMVKALIDDFLQPEKNNLIWRKS